VTEDTWKAQIAERVAAGKIALIDGKYSLPPKPKQRSGNTESRGSQIGGQ
jgi:hypothetical protein